MRFSRAQLVGSLILLALVWAALGLRLLLSRA
jgi:hypothetical protein